MVKLVMQKRVSVCVCMFKIEGERERMYIYICVREFGVGRREYVGVRERRLKV